MALASQANAHSGTVYIDKGFPAGLALSAVACLLAGCLAQLLIIMIIMMMMMTMIIVIIIMMMMIIKIVVVVIIIIITIIILSVFLDRLSM